MVELFIVKDKDGEKWVVLAGFPQGYLLGHLTKGLMRHVAWDTFETQYRFLKPLNIPFVQTPQVL